MAFGQYLKPRERARGRGAAQSGEIAAVIARGAFGPRLKMNAVMGLLLVTVLAINPVVVQAEDFPANPVRLIVPFPPGGIIDILSRIVGQKLSQGLGQPIVIDNRPGAGGNIGAEAAAKSPADGYTLFMGLISTHAINISLYKELRYDPVKDFQPISMVAKAPLILVVHPSVPARSVPELITYAKANPGKLNFASAGIGSASHIAMAMFASMAGIDLVHVAYKGTAPAQVDLLGGRAQGYFDAQISGLPNIQSGKVRALGVGSLKRLPALPDISPIAAAVPGYEFDTWFGILAPAGLPADRTERLNQAVRKVLADEDTKERFAKQGLNPMPSSPEEFTAFIVSETKRLGRIIRESGARAE